MLPVLTFFALLTQVLAWRFWPASGGLLASALLGVIVCCSCWLVYRRRLASGRLGLIAAGAALLTALVGLFPALWDCSTACSAGAYYAQLFGISNLLPATLAYALLTLLMIGEQRRAEALPATRLLGTILMAISLYYLWLSWRLDMRCGHCLAVHGCVLALAPRLLISSRPLLVPWLIAGCVVGLLHGIYHPGPRHSDTRSSPTAPLNWTAYDQADRGRHYGLAQAPWRVDIIYRFECRHCRDDLITLIRGVLPLVDAGDIQLRLLSAVLPGDAASRDRAHLIAAAAAEGALLPALQALLGAEGLNDAAGNRIRLQQSGHPAMAAVIARAKADRASWEHLIDHDQQRIAATRGVTPRVVLQAADGRRQVLDGTQELPAMLAAIRAHCGKDELTAPAP